VRIDVRPSALLRPPRYRRRDHSGGAEQCPTFPYPADEAATLVVTLDDGNRRIEADLAEQHPSEHRHDA